MTEADIALTRHMLVEDFERQAEWRAFKAEEYPEDQRNPRAAEWLRRLSEYVLALPNDDVRLRTITEAWASDDVDPSASNMLLGSYSMGIDSHFGQPNEDDFFTTLALEWARQTGAEASYREDPERIRGLIERDPSARDVVATRHRREGVEEFHRLLDDDAYFDEQANGTHGPEAVWQQFLQNNQWMLGGSLSVQFLPAWNPERLEQTVAGASVAGTGKRIDALLRTAGRVHSLVFVEIKHHRAKLLGTEYRPGIWAPSRELSGGVVQVQGSVQRAMIDIRDRLQDKASDGSDIPGEFSYLLRPRSYLIIGSLEQLYGEGGGLNSDKYQSFELYRRHTQEPEIVTFDELLARGEGLLDVADV